jgi:uncharacterized protein
MNRDKKAQFLINLYKNYRFNALGLYPPSYRYECAIRNPYHLTIGPEGEIYKCWNDVGNKEKIVGNLIDKEVTNKTLLTRYYVAGDALDSEECKQCFHFPVCGGGCPYVRIENEFNNANIDTCDYMKGNLQEFLELHYDFKKRTVDNKNK